MASGQTFGEFLRAERERKGWTIRQLADAIHISSDKSITAWETDRQRPQADNLAELGRVFGWDFNRVMTHLGAPALRGVDRIATGISRRPGLLALFQAAADLRDGQLDYLVISATALKAQRDMRKLDLDEKKSGRQDVP